MKKGITTIVMVLILSVISLLILIAWQSRVLLSIRRNQSLTDLISVDYKAESEIYDWAAKFVGNYSNIYGTPLDATERVLKSENEPNKLTVSAKLFNGEEQLSIKASRPYALTSMLLSRKPSSSSSSTIEKVEVVLGLDCSSSMNQQNRIQYLQAALQSFLLNIKNSTDADKFYLAMIPFRQSSNWAFGQNVPTNNIDLFYNQVKDASKGGSNWNSVSNSSLCATPGINICPAGAPSCGAETNLGTPGVTAMKYFTDNPVDESRVARTYILFTDGLPNTAHADLNCGTTACSVSESNGSCLDSSIKYLKCSLARDNYEWQPTYYGKRPSGVDVYSVTVANTPGGGNELTAYTATSAVFNDSEFVDRAYANSDASQLSSIFDGIFSQIITNAAKIKIERVVPIPLP